MDITWMVPGIMTTTNYTAEIGYASMIQVVILQHPGM